MDFVDGVDDMEGFEIFVRELCCPCRAIGMRGNGTQGAALGWVRLAFQAGMDGHTGPRPT